MIILLAGLAFVPSVIVVANIKLSNILRHLTVEEES